MKPTTERLLQAAAVVALLYFGWALVSQTVVQLIRDNSQIAQLQQQLSACQAKPAASK